jgi:hypothetical protein
MSTDAGEYGGVLAFEDLFNTLGDRSFMSKFIMSSEILTSIFRTDFTID